MNDTVQEQRPPARQGPAPEGGRSTGNVFADLDVPHPEVEHAKVRLAAEINTALALRGSSQAKRALVLGVAQPVVSNLERFELAGFSIERLMKYAKHLGLTVALSIGSSATER
jgi:predicted XRE-type DNA-binding protein